MNSLFSLHPVFYFLFFFIFNVLITRAEDGSLWHECNAKDSITSFLLEIETKVRSPGKEFEGSCQMIVHLTVLMISSPFFLNDKCQN